MNPDIKYNKIQRKRFLKCSLPLLQKWTEEVTGRAAVYGLSDELSVAIMAYNDAIDRFSGKGDFIEFARCTVRQRLYEYAQNRARGKSLLRNDFS